MSHPNLARFPIVGNPGVLANRRRNVVRIDAGPGVVPRDVHFHDAVVIHRCAGPVGVSVAGKDTEQSFIVGYRPVPEAVVGVVRRRVLLRKGAGRLVQRDHRLTRGVVGVESFNDVVESGRRPRGQKQPVVVLEDGPLTLRHETGGCFGQLLRKQRFRCVAGVGLTQCERSVVEPRIGVFIDVGVVAVGKEMTAYVVHGEGELPRPSIRVGGCSTVPMNTVIGNHLGPARSRCPRKRHAYVRDHGAFGQRYARSHVGVGSLVEGDVLHGTVAELVDVAGSNGRLGIACKESGHGSQRREDHHGDKQQKNGLSAVSLLSAALHESDTLQTPFEPCGLESGRPNRQLV